MKSTFKFELNRCLNDDTRAISTVIISPFFILNRNVDSAGNVGQRRRHTGALITLYATSVTKTSTKQSDVLFAMKNKATRRWSSVTRVAGMYKFKLERACRGS